MLTLQWFLLIHVLIHSNGDLTVIDDYQRVPNIRQRDVV